MQPSAGQIGSSGEWREGVPAGREPASEAHEITAHCPKRKSESYYHNHPLRFAQSVNPAHKQNLASRPVRPLATYGKLLFNIVASFAEFEHDLVAERTKDGVAAAKARGRMGGRKVSYTPLQAKTARTMKATGEHTPRRSGGHWA